MARSRPSLTDRLLLAGTASRTVDGLWIGWRKDDAQTPAAVAKVEAALALIKAADPRRYARLCADLDRILVGVLLGAVGSFNPRLRMCEIDVRLVLRADVSVPELAAVIVHEATHARIEARGITYRGERRPRIEAMCSRQEIAFAGRLTDGARVRARAERALAREATFWDVDEHVRRQAAAMRDALRHVGAPRWVVSAVTAMVPSMVAVWRLTRVFRRRG